MRRIAPLALLLASALPVRAEPVSDHVTVSILPGWRTEAGTHMAGFRIRMAPGWHTYWRAPGDAGIPPSFDWTGSDNIAGAGFHWPVPEVIVQNDMRSIGYKGDVVIPIELALDDPAAPARMAGLVQMGVCRDICMPVQLSFAADLPVGGDRPAALVAALVDQPLAADQAGVDAVSCSVAPIADGLSVTATVDMAPLGPDEAVVIEAGDPTIWVSEPASQRDGARLTAQADMVHVTGEPFALDRSQVRITVIAAGRAVDIRGCGG
ncbi:MAG: putative protein predicted to be involved in C-type cytochrome biogenesis [Rhodobacteraceae bacterium HLUCCA08]|nr:MAG: putative protein predicted to be involved in C-type cytochrome biogenesis [Rhodobacteraceae bacterium HLUCCA08]